MGGLKDRLSLHHRQCACHSRCRTVIIGCRTVIVIVGRGEIHYRQFCIGGIGVG